MTHQPRRWANRDNAAAYVDVHPDTIENWADDGLIHAYKIGPRLVRYDLNEIDAAAIAIARQEERSAAHPHA